MINRTDESLYFDGFFADDEPCIITVIGTGASLTLDQVLVAAATGSVPVNASSSGLQTKRMG